MFKEFSQPLSSDISRQNFLGLVALVTAVNLGGSYMEYQQGNDSIPFLKTTAESLTQEKQLITQYQQFRDGFRADGFDVSKYSLWNTVQHLGLIHALEATNRNPLIAESDSFRTIVDINTLKNDMADLRPPNYEKDIEIDQKSAYLGAGSAVAALSVTGLQMLVDKSNMPFYKKVNRRNFLNALAVTAAGLSLGATSMSVAHRSKYDMVNIPEYQNIPPGVLKQLTTGLEYRKFLNFYQSTLAPLPNRSLLKPLANEEFHEVKSVLRSQNDEAWMHRKTPEDTIKIQAKADYLERSSYESYRNRYDSVKEAILKYEPLIRDAHPESPALNYQYTDFIDTTRKGFGLELFNIVQRYQTNFELENPLIQ